MVVNEVRISSKTRNKIELKHKFPCNLDTRMNEQVIVMSCIFGTKFKKVYGVPVPMPDNCSFYFFTNNPELKNEIVSKGWNYVFVDFEVSNDPIVSSLQSKYVKFLMPKNEKMMPKNHNMLVSQFFGSKSGKRVVYFDHKLDVKSKHMTNILEVMNEYKDSSVIVRTTPRVKNTIWDEVNEASGQPRYKKNMQKTVALIHEKIANSEMTENVRICRTGILLYNNCVTIKEMLYEIYNLCVDLEQPECQIIWGIVSQKYEEFIKKLDWCDLCPNWAEP